MSLDVYLSTPDIRHSPSGSGIFVRENGQTVEITREEWDTKFPGREPLLLPERKESERVYSANITHNLNRMADEAGIYQYCWRPEELDITHAKQLIEPLEAAIATMKSNPDRFKKHNPANGWGSYDSFVPWLENYLAACRRYPDAIVEVSR